MQMGKWMTAMGAVLLFGLTGCARYEPAGAFEEPVTLTETESETSAGLERNAAKGLAEIQPGQPGDSLSQASQKAAQHNPRQQQNQQYPEILASHK